MASFIALVADLGTKEWAVAKLTDAPRQGIPVIEGIQLGERTLKLSFDLAKNPGGAWGVLGAQPDYIRLPFFFVVSALAVGFILSLFRKLEPRQRALKWALPLVLGGAIGNLVDRIRHQHVIDFIDAYVVVGGKAQHWPTFNVADIWIVLGVILMAIDMFTPSKPVTSKEARAKAEAEQAAGS